MPDDCSVYRLLRVRFDCVKLLIYSSTPIEMEPSGALAKSQLMNAVSRTYPAQPRLCRRGNLLPLIIWQSERTRAALIQRQYKTGDYTVLPIKHPRAMMSGSNGQRQCDIEMASADTIDVKKVGCNQGFLSNAD